MPAIMTSICQYDKISIKSSFSFMNADYSARNAHTSVILGGTPMGGAKIMLDGCKASYGAFSWY